MPYLQLPNGSYFEAPEGMDASQALQLAQQKHPKAFMSPEEMSSKQGFIPAAQEGFGQFITSAEEGLGERFNSDLLRNLAEKRKADAAQAGPQYIPTTSEDIDAASKEGLFSLAGAAARKYITEPLGGIAGRYGAPIAVGAAASAAAPVLGAGALGAGIIGSAATALTDLPAEIGENVQRQKEQGVPVDIESATVAGIGQAALAGFGIPGVGVLPKAAQKLFGSEVNMLGKKVLAGELTKEAAVKELSGTLSNVLKSTATNAVTGTGMMVGTEALRRGSAGQELTSPEAIEKYKQQSLGALEMAPIFGALHGVPQLGKESKILSEAAKQRAEIERKQKVAQEDATAAEIAETKHAEDLRQAQADTGDLFGENIKASELPNLPDNLTPFERERQQQERAIEEPTTQDLMRQRDLLYREENEQEKGHIPELQQRINEAAEKGDVDVIAQLGPQLEQAQKAHKELLAQLKKAVPVEEAPEVKAAALRGQIRSKTERLKKLSGAGGDFKQMTKLAGEIKNAQEQLKGLPEYSPDLLAQAESNRLKSEEETKQALAQQQEDLFASVPKTETRDQVKNRETLERYQESLQQLEDAHASGADQRIVEQLVEKVRTAAAEKAAAYAKTSETPDIAKEELVQARQERIKRAIAEAEAKGDTASVAGLRNRLAEVISENAKPDAATRRNKALEDQQAAIEEVRSNVEDLKSGRYLGEGTRDTATAASLKTGLEQKANEAIGKYVEAAIRDVNAVREQNNTRRLTNEEAIRLAMDVRGHLENAVRNLNEPALRMPKEGTVSTIEKQLAQIKKKHHVGPAIERRRAEDQGLRQEFAKAPIERKTDAQVRAEEERLAKQEQMQKEEQYFQGKKQPVQKSLFGEKELEPLATERATPENFQKLLKSKAVANLRAELAKLAKPLEKVKKANNKPVIYDSNLKEAIKQQERAAIEVKNTHAAFEALKKDIEETQALTNYTKDILDKTIPGESEWPVETAMKHEQSMKPYEMHYKKLLNSLEEKKAALEEFSKTYADHLESSVAVERALLKALEKKQEKMEKGSPEQQIIQAEADAARAREAIVEREAKDIAKDSIAEQRKKEQARLEAAAKASETAVRKEIVATKYKVTNPEQLKKLKQLKTKLSEELRKEESDPKIVEDLQKKIAQIAPDEPILREKITNPIPFNRSETLKEYTSPRTIGETSTGRAEKKAAQQKQEKEDALARAEKDKVNRTKLADALREESKVSADLKEVRRQIENIVNVITGLERSLKFATKPKAKELFEKRLQDVRADFEKKGLLNEEKRLSDKLRELRTQGVGVERALETVGNKPGRESQTKVKGPELTEAQKKARKTAAAERSKLNEDFSEYLESEKRGLYEDYSGYYSGNKYRAEAESSNKIDAGEAQDTSERIEKGIPKDVNVKSVAEFEDLPQKIKDALALDGITEESGNTKTVRGFVTPEGDVYIVRGNHENAKDLEKTYVHEIIGHEGVDRILGEEGTKKLADHINGQEGGMEALAKELNVLDQVQGALNDAALGIKKMTDKGASKEAIDKAMKDMETTAIRELIAYTSEQRVTENLSDRAKRWLKELVGAVRAGLRRAGFLETSKMTTSDIYHLIRQSQFNYNRGTLGAMRESGGAIKFAKNKATYNPDYNPEMVKMSDRFVAKQQSTTDKIKGYALGMSFMHRFTDQYAGLEHIAKTMADSLKGMQMMYFNRLYNQNSNMTSEIATHGPVGLKITQGSKEEGNAEYQYVSRKTGGLSPILAEIGKSAGRIGNTQAALNQFSLYMAAERIEGLAKSKDISISAAAQRLNLKDEFTPEEMAMVLKDGRGDKNFQAAREKYREYNNGMLDLLVDTGRMSEEVAADLKKGDYIPFYRERNGEVWDNEYNISIGNIKDQPYLKELVGGDKPIISFEVSALQNTHMLTEMAMRNIATKNTAHTLRTLGIAEVHNGKGPASPDVIRFYDKGKEQYARLNTKDAFTGMEEKLEAMREKGKAGTEEYKKLRERAEKSRESSALYGNIPAELIVKGMEGTGMTMPAAISFLRGPSNLLRKFITRNPLYALRVLQKDSIDSWVRTGADTNPLIGAISNVKKAMEGGEQVRGLQAQGITGGHVFSGTFSDMRTIAMQIAEGKSGWEQKWAKLDRMAMIADEAARLNLYNGFVKKGLSPMEASLATLEAQNFTKHGYSPTMRMMTVMIPFFNAQVSGLNNFVRSMAGKSLFEDKLNVRETMLKRGALLAGSTMLYSALVQNTKAYKDASESERLNNWFIPLPGTDEMMRVGIPFESGFVFKALPEAVLNLMSKDEKAKDVLPAVRDALLSNIPGFTSKFMPQGVKPLVEGYTNKDFFTGAPIESDRQLLRVAGERYGPKTTEASKLLGGKVLGPLLGISPLQIDHAINGYTSGTGLALLSMFNPMLRTSAEPPSGKLSDTAFIGGMIQPADGHGLISKAYNDAKTIDQINNTYKDKAKSDPKAAEQFLRENLKQISAESASGAFKKEMASLADYERAIRVDTKKSASEKQKEIDRIKEIRERLSKQFMSISRG